MDITVVYGRGKGDDDIVIIGFEVAPSSKAYNPTEWEGLSEEQKQTQCPQTPLGPLKMPKLEKGSTDTETVIWTYSVTWEPSDIPWTERWNVYLASSPNQIHWISIVNSLMIVLFLTGTLSHIYIFYWCKMLTKLFRYGRYDYDEDTQSRFEEIQLTRPL